MKIVKKRGGYIVKKTILRTILTTLILLIMSCSAFAAQDNNILDEELVKILIEKGVPQYYIDDHLKHVNMLKEMAEMDGMFIKAEKTIFVMDEQTGEVTVKEKIIVTPQGVEKTEGIVPQGVIPSNELGLWLSTWSRSSSQPDAYAFYTSWNWLDMPDMRFTDLIGMAWSDSFTIESDSIHGAHEWETDMETYSETYNQYNATKITPETGFCFDSDIRAAALEDWGYVSVNVYHGTNEIGSANVTADYYHEYVNLGLPSITISSSPTITLSTSWNYDHAVRLDDFTY